MVKSGPPELSAVPLCCHMYSGVVKHEHLTIHAFIKISKNQTQNVMITNQAKAGRILNLGDIEQSMHSYKISNNHRLRMTS